MAGKTQYKNNWQKENIDRINLTMAKGRKDAIRAFAAATGESVNGFINRAISDSMELEKSLMNEEAFFQWHQTASEDDLAIFERVKEFETLFQDMIFSEGTPPHKFVACQSKLIGTEEWFDDEVPLPDELKYFSYTFFTYHAKDLGGFYGQFNSKEHSLSIDPNHINDDSTIVHEMIHLHEFVIDRLPLFFHDAVLFCLYKDLKLKISDLDERIEAHGHILTSSLIAQRGGTHDILFLLKSFDLDLKMGYKLGTVFGYGMINSIERDTQK